VKTETITILNKKGENLVGLHYKRKDDDKVVIVIHGYATTIKYGSGKLAEHMSQKGFNTIIFDLSGYGESGGDHASRTISVWCEDILSVVDYSKSIGYKHIAFLTSSMGNMHGLLAAAREKSVERIFCWGPSMNFAERNDITKGKGWDDDWKEKGFRITHANKGIDFRSDIALLEDARSIDFRTYLPHIQADTLFAYGSEDEHVAPELIKTATELMPNASAIVLDGIDHFTSKENMPTILELVDDWFTEW